MRFLFLTFFNYHYKSKTLCIFACSLKWKYYAVQGDNQTLKNPGGKMRNFFSISYIFSNFFWSFFFPFLPYFDPYPPGQAQAMPMMQPQRGQAWIWNEEMLFKQRCISSFSSLFTECSVNTSVLSDVWPMPIWSIMTTQRCLMMSPCPMSSTLYDNWSTSIMRRHSSLMSPSLLPSTLYDNWFALIMKTHDVWC